VCKECNANLRKRTATEPVQHPLFTGAGAEEPAILRNRQGLSKTTKAFKALTNLPAFVSSARAMH
jgi:hypothetical protein